jgi:hypothetical protein
LDESRFVADFTIYSLRQLSTVAALIRIRTTEKVQPKSRQFHRFAGRSSRQ